MREQIVEAGRRLWLRGFVASNDGNISGRVADDRVIVTPSGVSKGFLTPDDLVAVALDGTPLDEGKRPSSEILLHLNIYRRREDVCGIVHAHPPTATGFACTGRGLERPFLPEVVVALKAIPLAPYGTPASEELSRSIEPYLQDYDAFLLANHGALTVGRDVMQAYFRMETVEHCAHIAFVARTLGGEVSLEPEQVQRLQQLRQEFGVEDRTSCLGCGLCQVRDSHERFNGRPPETECAPGTYGACGRQLSPAQPREKEPVDAAVIARIAEQVVRELLPH